MDLLWCKARVCRDDQVNVSSADATGDERVISCDVVALVSKHLFKTRSHLMLLRDDKNVVNRPTPNMTRAGT
jgi:hypothetical protein